MKVERVVDSKCICENCNSYTAIVLITMNFERIWLCDGCAKELKKQLK